jgi:hypothetical protein
MRPILPTVAFGSTYQRLGYNNIEKVSYLAAYHSGTMCNVSVGLQEHTIWPVGLTFWHRSFTSKF